MCTMTIALSLPLAGGALCLLVGSGAALAIGLVRRATRASPAIDVARVAAGAEEGFQLRRASVG